MRHLMKKMGKTDFSELREMRSFPSFEFSVSLRRNSEQIYIFYQMPAGPTRLLSLLAVAVGAGGDALVLLEGAG